MPLRVTSPYSKSLCKETCGRYHVSGEPASDGLAAGDGQVGNKEDDVGDDVDDEAVVRDGGAPFGSIAHHDVVLAVEVFDRRSEAEDGDEGRRYCQLENKTINHTVIPRLS